MVWVEFLLCRKRSFLFLGFVGQLIENGMEQDLRNKRLRAMVRQLNAERKRHAMKVDIL